MTSVRQQAREFFRFEMHQQWREWPCWLSLLASIAVGVTLGAAEVGGSEVAVGRLARNVPYAVVHGVTTLSAVGMFVVLVTVGTAALRDFSAGSAQLVFSKPIRSSAYLLGRFLAGYSSAMLALTAGVIAMAVTQGVLQGSDPDLGPVPWSAFAYGWIGFLAPNVLLVGLLLFLMALWTRSMGATFLGLLPIIIGQDIAEALPVGVFGYRVPAVLDPIGIAALHSATHTWTLKQYASALPAFGGDLLLNRVLWLLVSMVVAGLAGTVFSRKARKADLGQRRRKSAPREPREQSAATPGGGRAVIATGRRLRRAQLWSVARFELLRMASSLAFKVVFVTGLAVVVYSMLRGDTLLGVRLIPGGQIIGQSIRRASSLTMTLMVVLFTGELVWRERSTRMGLTLDCFPVRDHVMVSGKVIALGVLLVGSVAVYGAVAWGVQIGQAGHPAPLLQVAAAVGHESLQIVQLAAVALFLQALCGGRMTGYLAMGAFLILRIGLRALGYEGHLYAFAGMRMPFLSDMNGFGAGLALWGVVQLYWSLIAVILAIAAGLFWPRGVALGSVQRWAQAGRRLSRGGALTSSGAVLAAVSCGALLYVQAEATGKGWDRDALEGFLLDYEQEFSGWRGRPRPEVVDIKADLDFAGDGRCLRVRGRYRLHNPHAEAVDSMLVSYDPDLRLRGLALNPVDMAEPLRRDVLSTLEVGVAPGAADLPGTHVLRFDPPLGPGADVQLDFDLEFDPDGWGSRPADHWLVANGAFALCGPGTHAFFRGAQCFLTLGYDSAREVRRTRARHRRGLGPWAALPTPEDYRQGRAAAGGDAPRGEGVGGADWASVELWIHTGADVQAVAPGALIERVVTGDRASHHFEQAAKIQPFFPVMCGRYETVVASHGDVQLELYCHPAHAARADHILWAMQRSLAYFEAHWGPYPHGVLRLVEIPGQEGAAFACSFPGGMMGFAESMGFRSPRGDGRKIDFPERSSPDASPADLDPVLWVVAHEVAHQWWDSHVLAAEALGAGFVSETLAQYGSLCVVQAEYGDDVALRMAEYNRQVYLEGRRLADRQELSLASVDDQDHLHYGKGFVAFHALAKLAGYAPIDRALAEVVATYAGEQGAPVTSLTIVEALIGTLPPELTPQVREWLEQVHFLDAAVRSAECRRTADQGYALVVECAARSVHADGNGEEAVREFAGQLELEVWLLGVDRPVRLQAGARGGLVRFEATFARRPLSVVLDPRLLHMDRDLSDNRRSVVETSR